MTTSARTAAGGRAHGWARGAVSSPRRVLALVLGIVAIVLIAQNTARVKVRIFTVTVHAPLWLLLACSVAVGVLIGVLLARARRRQAQPPQPTRPAA